MLHQLRKSGAHATWRVIGEVSDRFLGNSPLAKEIENFASNRCTGYSQSLGKIMKEQLPVLPVSQQTPSPPQLHRRLAHLFLADVVSPLRDRQNQLTWASETEDPDGYASSYG